MYKSSTAWQESEKNYFPKYQPTPLKQNMLLFNVVLLLCFMMDDTKPPIKSFCVVIYMHGCAGHSLLYSKLGEMCIIECSRFS